MKQFNLGDIVYFIASNRIVKEAKVIRNAGFVMIKFDEGNCRPSGTRVRESKLYHTKEEVEAVVKKYKDMLR